MKTYFVKKSIAVGIILLFIGIIFTPLTQSTVVEKSKPPIISGNILYVGGNRPNNYTYIQDAINDASDGDIVFVYNGTYYENIEVKKSIIPGAPKQ